MRWLLCLGMGCALSASVVQAADTKAAVAQFEKQFPDVKFYMTGPRITSVYGPAFGFGNNPEEVAARLTCAHEAS